MRLDEHAATEIGSSDLERLVRLSARLCCLIRDANNQTWFAPQVRQQIDELHQDLVSCQEEGGSGLRLELHDGVLGLGQARLDSPPRAVRQLIHMFERKGFAGVEFDSRVTPYEVVLVAQILQSKTARPPVSELQQLKHAHFIEHEDDRIELVERIQATYPGRRIRIGDEADAGVRSMVVDITAAIDAISSGNAAPEFDAESEANEHVDSGLLALVGNLGKNAEIALILSSLRRHDEYTYDHSVNVGLLSICLARHIGWKGSDLHDFGVAALIHDVGKLYTPLEILNKPGRLTPQEWIVMKRHPRDGYDILKEGGVGSEIAPSIALEHHTSPTGEGYPPLPYPVERMHPGSHIVKIADVYDAFTTIRPYRSQTRPKEVLKMLRNQRGTHFDGDLVDAFIEMMGEYPIGTTLKLKSGRIGLVVDVHGEAPTRPLVRVLQDERGRKPKQLELVDLRQRHPETRKHLDDVVEAIDPVIRNIPIGRYI